MVDRVREWVQEHFPDAGYLYKGDELDLDHIVFARDPGQINEYEDRRLRSLWVWLALLRQLAQEGG
ncbi:MAG TPA: hypothetical protein VMS08_04370 [Candidatus Saccharimonadia bacterium]|nr:hypothetical protein [Candidatus Saccharimonadia bacterium]